MQEDAKRASVRPAGGADVAADVRAGLTGSPKRLPPYLFYDAEGSRLYEQITDLPEYYLTRAERQIFEAHSDEIVLAAREGTSDPLRIVELGAGTAAKTEILLRAVVDQQGSCAFFPIDVSPAALDIAHERISRGVPGVSVETISATHAEALPRIRAIGPRRLVLFIGSSIGNFDDDEATALLAALADVLAPGGALLLGTDLRKSPDVLLPAYDDSAGVTAAFNKNLLARLNRELDADFDLASFRHVARWNDKASRVEMHLESLTDQTVTIGQLGLDVSLRRGETIHTESSIKYDLARVDRVLASAGFVREKTFSDPRKLFGLHLARLARPASRAS